MVNMGHSSGLSVLADGLGVRLVNLLGTLSVSSRFQMGIPHWVKILQDLFVLWVLVGAAWGWFRPETASLGKIWIPEALSTVMLGMGLTLTYQNVLGLRRFGSVLILGVTLQYLIMPLAAWLIAMLLGLPQLLALGVILVGSCPGGTASNVVTYLARGDVALSVGMTTLSTILSPILTPFWIWVLASTWLSIDPLPLLWTVGKIVLFPVVIGIILRCFWTPGLWLLEGLLPVFSMAVIAWLVGVIVGLNHDQLNTAIIVFGAVIAHNVLGLGVGYWGSGIKKTTDQQQRTVAIEVGMQNSGLAVALAIAHFGPMAAVPGAIFSIWHNLTGSLLASFWRYQKTK